MTTTVDNTIDLTVEDFTGQVRRRVRGVPKGATIGDLLGSLVSELRLPANDGQGRPVTYAARVRGESLAESDRVGDVLQQADEVTLSQNVTAG
jgi:hypothetical protein